jgi:hypothetical protein
MGSPSTDALGPEPNPQLLLRAGSRHPHGLRTAAGIVGDRQIRATTAGRRRLKRQAAVQLAAAARELPHVVPVFRKSPASTPVTTILVMDSAVVPTLVSVTFLTTLVKPTAKVPKLRGVGASLAVVPVPLSGTFCGLPAALSVTLTDALRAPLADGLN